MRRTPGELIQAAGSAAGSPATADAEDLLRAIAELAHSALRADAVTLACCSGSEERVIIVGREGAREAHGSISLTALKPGVNRLAGGAGVLQSVEVASLIGFQPTGYLGAPFDRASGLEGGLAVWEAGQRDWKPEELELLQGLTAICRAHAATAMAAKAESSPALDPSARYRKLFEQFSDPIFITDREGAFIEANPAAFDFFGLDGNLDGYRITDFYRDQSEYSSLVQQLAGGAVRVEMEVAFRNVVGRPLIGLLSALPLLDEEGKVMGHQAAVHDITERRALEDRLRSAALHDPLTGLPNRALFLDRLGQALARSRRQETSRYAVVFIDLDGFKAVNDNFGHTAGDQLLYAIGRRLQSTLRGMDTVARMGGDEFAILIEDVADAAVAERLVERLVAELNDPYRIDGRTIRIRPSIGLTMGSPRYASAEEVIGDADAAMYLSRAGDRKEFQLFDDDARRAWSDRLASAHRE